MKKISAHKLFAGVSLIASILGIVSAIGYFKDKKAASNALTNTSDGSGLQYYTGDVFGYQDASSSGSASLGQNTTNAGNGMNSIPLPDTSQFASLFQGYTYINPMDADPNGITASTYSTLPVIGV